VRALTSTFTSCLQYELTRQPSTGMVQPRKIQTRPLIFCSMLCKTSRANDTTWTIMLHGTQRMSLTSLNFSFGYLICLVRVSLSFICFHCPNYICSGLRKDLLPRIIHFSAAEPFTKCMASFSLCRCYH
jgi:hypothetical protein